MKIIMNNDGTVSVQMPSVEVLTMAIPQMLSGFQSSPKAVGDLGIRNTANLRAVRRGQELPNSNKVMKLQQLSDIESRITIRRKQAVDRLPRLRLSPKGWRDLETLYLDIKCAIDYYFELVSDNKSKEARSNFCNDLLEGFKAETGYEADRKTTLGRVCSGSSKTNKLIRDGKGQEYLDYIRKLTRIASSEMVRI